MWIWEIIPDERYEKAKTDQSYRKAKGLIKGIENRLDELYTDEVTK